MKKKNPSKSTGAVKVNSKDIWAHRESILFRETNENELVIIDTASSSDYFKVNLITADLWKMIDGKSTVEQIVANLEKLTQKKKIPGMDNLSERVHSALLNFAQNNLIEKL